MNTIPKQVFEGLIPINSEKLKEIRVHHKGHLVTVGASDLRELMFRFTANSQIRITSDIFYKLLIDYGIHVKGFRPEKTVLRHTYKLSLEKINEIMPNS